MMQSTVVLVARPRSIEHTVYVVYSKRGRHSATVDCLGYVQRTNPFHFDSIEQRWGSVFFVGRTQFTHH